MKPHLAIFVLCCVLYALLVGSSLGLTPNADQAAATATQQQSASESAAASGWQARQRAIRTNTQRRAAGNANTNYNYNRSSSATPVCEYQTMMSNIHDRVGVLASLDEDQRNRLEAISLKLTQFEASNLGRLDSIAVKQTDMQSRLEALEHMQRLVRSTVDELKGESEQVFRAIGGTRDAGVGGKQRHRRSAEFSRFPRQASPNAGATSQGEVTPESLAREIFATSSPAPSSDQKLDALATLLASTAASLQSLRSEMQSNFRKLERNRRNFKRVRGGQKGNSPGINDAASSEVVESCQQAEVDSGIARLQLTPLSEPFYARCEQDGWLVVLNRFSDNVNFERDWTEYKAGFGNLAGEFFIGLEKLHALTSAALHELRIVLEDHEGNEAQAGYSLFAISGEEDLYALNLLGEFDNGSAGDALSYHAGAKFSTFDHDNDGCIECNCAAKAKGGWWFNACATSNLMGNYFVQNYDKAPEDEGIYWRGFPQMTANYSLRRVRLLIRPVSDDTDRR